MKFGLALESVGTRPRQSANQQGIRCSRLAQKAQARGSVADRLRCSRSAARSTLPSVSTTLNLTLVTVEIWIPISAVIASTSLMLIWRQSAWITCKQRVFRHVTLEESVVASSDRSTLSIVKKTKLPGNPIHYPDDMRSSLEVQNAHSFLSVRFARRSARACSLYPAMTPPNTAPASPILRAAIHWRRRSPPPHPGDPVDRPGAINSPAPPPQSSASGRLSDITGRQRLLPVASMVLFTVASFFM